MKDLTRRRMAAENEANQRRQTVEDQKAKLQRLRRRLAGMNTVQQRGWEEYEGASAIRAGNDTRSSLRAEIREVEDVLRALGVSNP